MKISRRDSLKLLAAAVPAMCLPRTRALAEDSNGLVVSLPENKPGNYAYTLKIMPV